MIRVALGCKDKQIIGILEEDSSLFHDLPRFFLFYIHKIIEKSHFKPSMWV